MNYPKRLIEVDLPIKRISEHARREKSIRHGHISTLHIWWARRPLAACRAVLCASLWPDPADPLCPSEFIEVAKEEMLKWASNDFISLLSKESVEHFIKVNNDEKVVENTSFLRALLLDFIADFANWSNSLNELYLRTCRKLTETAHVSLGGTATTGPLVVDPFAGGGSIPLEAVRIGADAYASDLNPIPVLINKVQLEYIPRYGKQLSDEVRKWGIWVKEEAEKKIGKFYPSNQNPQQQIYTPQIEEISKRQNKAWKFVRIKKEIPIAYLWARTVVCEGPNCGAKVPLIRSTYLAKKGKKAIGVKIVPNLKGKHIEFQIVNDIKIEQTSGTIKRGSASCPFCGFVTPVASVRKQLKTQNGGAKSSTMYCVVTLLETERQFNNQKQIFEELGRFYRLPLESDMKSMEESSTTLKEINDSHKGDFSFIPDEETPKGGGKGAGRAFSQRNYGMDKWESLFNARQSLGLGIISDLISSIPISNGDIQFKNAIKTCLAFALNKQADSNNSLCAWRPTSQDIGHMYSRQALPIVWDFVEANIFSGATRDFLNAVEGTIKALTSTDDKMKSGTSNLGNASNSLLPDDSVDCLFTDPPYYDAVPYADLSDFFYVILKRTIRDIHPELLANHLTNKDDECIVDDIKGKDNEYFEKHMGQAMLEGRRICTPNGIGIIVFAHKSTEGWESQLKAMLDAGWIFTASWPVDTEMSTRLRAQNSAALASSIHLVCRPRENEDGSLRTQDIGYWNDVLKELPVRIHEWMPRLASEGVVGADAIFACLGPALEIFSRYHKVVMPGSEKEVSLKDYLEKVWEAVSKEALKMVFDKADASGFEEDARITAMWLWTITAGKTSDLDYEGENDHEDEENEDELNLASSANKVKNGYILEYDTARKISQGLGADLNDLYTLIEVKGDKARLLPVVERTKYLFGSQNLNQQPVKRKKKLQGSLFESIPEDPESKYELTELKIERTGQTILDRLHQAMLLFASTRTEALKRFLTEDGVGRDERFWKLAQAFTALYPKETEERRWVEALQTYKKGLGF